ncbi:MAG: DUF2383 domain-containing protein [Methylococcales bacterium]
MHNLTKIDKLLKDELSAIETYQQALDALKEDVSLGNAESLVPIYEDHQAAASSLQAQIRQLGGTPSADSGAWGTWAKMILGGAHLLGKESALKALQEGESSGVKDYEKALLDHDLSAEVRALIETKLLPAQQAHIRTLDKLIDAASA